MTIERLYICNDCNTKNYFPINFISQPYCNKCRNNNLDYLRKVCPLCKRAVYKKNEGLVCKNRDCVLGRFKLGIGWVYLDGRDKNNMQFFQDKYQFDINHFKNRKRWLELKSLKLLESNNKCEICYSNINPHVHHILRRSDNPNLTLDIENLMVLCESCHKKIHQGDKHYFGRKGE